MRYKISPPERAGPISIFFVKLDPIMKMALVPVAVQPDSQPDSDNPMLFRIEAVAPRLPSEPVTSYESINWENSEGEKNARFDAPLELPPGPGRKPRYALTAASLLLAFDLCQSCMTGAADSLLTCKKASRRPCSVAFNSESPISLHTWFISRPADVEMYLI
jgi:hypothetical protein